jgi:hypothetical protein
MMTDDIEVYSFCTWPVSVVIRECVHVSGQHATLDAMMLHDGVKARIVGA